MRTLLRVLSLPLALTACLGFAACGGSGSSVSPGAGTISITTFLPATLGCAPTPFTITGTGFETVTGTTALVKFTATGGAAPFGGSSTATVIGLVTSDTTITGTGPAVDLCGLGPVSVDISVTLESGVSSATTGLLTISTSTPTVGSILPVSLPAAIPTAFTITGTGFGTGAVVVRFISNNPAGSGNFDDGTADFADVVGTAATTTITGTSPVARACPSNFPASVQVFLTAGCCTPPTAPGFVTFLAPTITSGGFGVSSLIPTPLTLVGTNFGVVGETGIVRLSTLGGAGGTIFGNGSFQTIDIPGVVGAGSTSVAFTTPVTALCTPTISALTSLRWIAPRGSSCQVGSSVTFTTNVITLASAPTIPALLATPETFTFSSALPPVGTLVKLVYTSTSAGTPPIFNDGTATTHSNSAAVVATATTVTATAPAATLCGIDTATASVVAYWNGGSCSASGATLLTYQRPSLATASPGGIQNPGLPVPSFPNNNMFANSGNEPFVLTALPGRNFGPIGSVVQVRFSSPFLLIFQGGAQNYDTVIGQVTSATTITGATPVTTSVSLAIASISVQAFWEDGTCSDVTGAQFVSTSNRAFATGTSIYTINQSGGGAPALIGAPLAGLSTPVIDARKNRLYAMQPVLNFIEVFDTAQTMLATPVIPTSVGQATASVPSASDLQIATLDGKLWQSDSTSNVIFVFQQAAIIGTGLSQAFIVNTPIATVPRRMLYNPTSHEMVVAITGGTSQMGVYDAATGTLNAIFLIPPVGTAVWNQVMGLRPGASGTARAYMIYDDPAVANADAIGTLLFSTGVITTLPTVANSVSAGIPNALAYDGLRDQLVWWNSFIGGQIQRNNSTTLVALATAPLGGNVTSISTNTILDRYYLSNNGAANVNSINGATLLSAGTVVVPAAGKNACTTP